MRTITYTQARNNFAKEMNNVCDNHAPVVITRQNRPPVVIISLEDYNNIEETLHLLRSPANRVRLLKGLRDYKKGKFKKNELKG